MTDNSKGLTFGFAAYALWGLFPLYFVLFERSGALEVVAHRALWSLVFCALLLTVLRQWGQVKTVVSHRRTALSLAVAGVLIVVNWSTYVFAVLSGHTLETALGYFINPLAVAALGILVLGEKLRPLQWTAMFIGLASVLVMVVAYGQMPWAALVLALSFGTYSLVKKIAGRSVGALPGLAVETGAVAPIALGFIIYLAVTGQSTASGGYGALLATTGVVTAIPLLLFAAAARRVSMVTVAILQYIAPIGQFLLGWLYFGEPMPASRWAGFTLVWVAVALFVADAMLVTRRTRRLRATPAGP
ncbi:EamA family transporter RarD [Tessaracoccus massiliensis]|uniref:EamA family transporter RarD n=1 Tax=Tessaracoccus massiliensis TaxID=1522311 RepID=UPI00058E4CA6|nr:EamA family transporter RarD [Tessaracoccus massiliensis]